jgi:hypothetical protein
LLTNTQKEGTGSREFVDKKELKLKKIKSLSDIPENYLARQISLTEQQLFLKIKARELHNRDWETNQHNSLNEIRENFNGVSIM